MLHRPRVAVSKALLATLLLAGLGSALADFDRAGTVRLATTTSTENSGLLNDLLPRFGAATGYEVHVVAVGTGKALRMGRDGDVDVVLVHAPAAERRFVDEGYGEQRLPVMFNDFVIVGPPGDPAGLQQATSASDALKRIAQTNSAFVSRGDDSGTHKKELTIWREADLKPAGAWYREAGQGMGKVLQMADELDAYTLTDRGTWLAYRDKSRLRIAYQGHEELHNPYAIIAVSAKRYPDLNHQGAMALIEWIRGPEGQQAIAAYRKSGEQLFTPSAGRLARR
jgi:tungstate transport system substrate-binding protein